VARRSDTKCETSTNRASFKPTSTYAIPKRSLQGEERKAQRRHSHNRKPWSNGKEGIRSAIGIKCGVRHGKRTEIRPIKKQDLASSEKDSPVRHGKRMELLKLSTYKKGRIEGGTQAPFGVLAGGERRIQERVTVQLYRLTRGDKLTFLSHGKLIKNGQILAGNRGKNARGAAWNLIRL